MLEGYFSSRYSSFTCLFGTCYILTVHCVTEFPSEDVKTCNRNAGKKLNK